MHYTMLFIAGFLLSLFHLIIYMGVQTPTSFRARKFCRLLFLSFSHVSPERNSGKSNEAFTTPKDTFKMETETVYPKNLS